MISRKLKIGLAAIGVTIAAMSVAAPATAADEETYGGYTKAEWIAAAHATEGLEISYLEDAWSNEAVRRNIATSTTETVTRGPVTIVPGQSVSARACGPQRSTWVEVTRTRNGPLYAFYRLTTRLNYVYDGCRTRYSSTNVTPQSLGAGWTVDSYPHSANGYEYANGSSYGRTYTERNVRWRNDIDIVTSYGTIATRCHANWDATTGCSSSLL